MAFEKVNLKMNFISLKDVEEGTILVEGAWIGNEPNKFGGINVKFKNEKGINCIGSKILAENLEEHFTEGDYLQVTFAGKQESKSTGNMYNTFDIAIDADRSVKLMKEEIVDTNINENVAEESGETPLSPDMLA